MKTYISPWTYILGDFLLEGFYSGGLISGLIIGISYDMIPTNISKMIFAVPPFITVHPQSKMRISEQGVTFCCDGEGNPAPEIEW